MLRYLRLAGGNQAIGHPIQRGIDAPSCDECSDAPFDETTGAADAM